MQDEKEKQVDQVEPTSETENDGLELSSLLLQNVNEQNQDVLEEAETNSKKKPKKAKKAKKEVKEEEPEEELNKNGKKKFFRKYKIKDVVFLAIMSACMLVTGAIMPLVGQIPIFGIVQLCLGLQFSLFPAIGLMKVRKPGALFIMALFCGVVLGFMAPVMFVVILLCALVTEILVGLIFRGYDKDGACVTATTLFFPLTLPFMYIWYRYFYTFTGEEGEYVNAFIGADPGFAVGITIACIAICLVGSILGAIITRELRKAGVIKK